MMRQKTAVCCLWLKVLQTTLGYRIAYSLFTLNFTVWIGKLGGWKG